VDLIRDLLKFIVNILVIAYILLARTLLNVIDFKFVPCIYSFCIFVVLQKELLLVGLVVIATRR
jgi:hypothetical protein